MPTVSPPDGPSRSGPLPRPVPNWKKPIGYLLAQGAGEERVNATIEDVQKFVKTMTEGVYDRAPSLVAPIANFILKRNPVELGGILAAIGGVFSGILGLIGIDRICKWGGLLFLIGGAVAAVAGKLLGVSLSTKEKGSEDVGSGTPTNRNKEEELDVPD